MWICPECSRTFKNTHQDHSCFVTDIESHFIGKQENVKSTFNTILAITETFENVTINSVKNAILFTAKTHFLAVKPRKAGSILNLFWMKMSKNFQFIKQCKRLN